MDIINGFNQDAITKLYAFVKAYEDVGVKSFEKEKDFLIRYPELKGLLNDIKEVNCHWATSEKMKQLNLKQFNNEIYLLRYKKSYLLDLLYHLRNAIAHACVIEHNGAVLITDFKVSKPMDFSARGRIELRIIENFTKTLNKAEL